MNDFEITISLMGTNPEEIAKCSEDVDKIFAKNNVEIKSTEDWGTKRLWHIIRKPDNSKADSVFYKFYVCSIEKSKVLKLKKDFKLSPSVLRTTIFKVRPPKAVKIKKRK